jgi:hypothetical protein
VGPEYVGSSVEQLALWSDFEVEKLVIMGWMELLNVVEVVPTFSRSDLVY